MSEATEAVVPVAPPANDITLHGAKNWVYATVDGRDFKIHEDDDGDFDIRERTADDTWVSRYGPDYETLTDAIYILYIQTD